MEQGVVFGRDMLGYDVRDGKLIINEEGAEIVRLIFHKYLDEGKGCHVIANELSEAGIQTSRFMKEWSYTVILRVLKNEKYCGDLVQQKTYTASYLSHKKKANNGELDYVVIKDHHEPIIPRERFEAAQRELERRHNMHYTKNGFANRYAMSGKIICAECGSTFCHSQKKCPNGTKYENWSCVTKDHKGKRKTLDNGDVVGCDNVIIRDADVRLILTHIIRDVMGNREALLDSVLGTVKEVLRVCADKNNVEYFEKEIAKLEAKKEKLLDMCLSGDIETSDYKKASDRLCAEHAALLAKLNEEKANRALVADKSQIIESITEYVNSVAVGEEWDDIIYRNLVDKIYVHKDRTIDVHLKLIPEKWQAKILKGKAEIERFEQNQKILANGGTSVPVEDTIKKAEDELFKRKYPSPFNEEEYPEEAEYFSLAQLAFTVSGIIPPRYNAILSRERQMLLKENIPADKVNLLLEYLSLAYSLTQRDSDYRVLDDEIDNEEPIEVTENNVPDAQEKQLKSEIKRLNNLVHQLDKQNKVQAERLSQYERELKESNAELAELRSMVHPASEIQEKEKLKVQFPYTAKSRSVIIGGHETWAKAIKPLLKNVRFIDLHEQPNAGLIANSEVVWIQNNALAHKHYYKVMDIVRKYKIKVCYFQFASAEKCAEQFAMEDLEISEKSE